MIETLDQYFEGGLIQSLIAWAFSIVLAAVIYNVFRSFLNKSDNDSKKTILQIVRITISIICIYSCLNRILVLNDFMVTILASSGVIALAVSLAAQESLGNIIAGIIILLTKPYKVNDLIKIADGKYIGYVEDITLHHTIIRTYENNRIAIPNSTMSDSAIENSDLIESRKANFLEVQISYESDLDKAMEILKELGDSHPKSLKNTTVRVTGFADSGINLRAIVYSENSLSGFNICCDIRRDIIYSFREHGIVIPYPTRTVKIDNDMKEE
ncbi:MAG: mechanosensitive ion channel family protein [Erysipelotrichaceae bacterium]|nr:mechanosensitive ion channel family protein [Erysipelotrichaceae bacterium]